MGSIIIVDETAIGDFQLTAEGDSDGSAVYVRFFSPDSADAPDWNRNIIILRKQGEWPQAYNDPDTVEITNATYPTEGRTEFHDTDLVPGQIYYYGLFAQKYDNSWVGDPMADRASAYPYARWGFADYLFRSLPRGWRSSDETGDLQAFLTIFGALCDNMKTDCEHLLSLFAIDEIHDDLIQFLDRKIGWPTWHTAGGLKRRKETSEAVTLYTEIGIGRAAAYEQMLEEISDWDAVIYEGWRYVMFTNGLYGSTTPDLSTVPKQEEIQQKMGRPEDLLKYTNNSGGWNSVNGLFFFLYEIPGVSGELTSAMLNRYEVLIEWGKASYVITRLVVVPTHAEEFDVDAKVTEDVYTYPLGYVPAEESVGVADEDDGSTYTTTSWDLFETNNLTKTTNNTTDRLYHSAITYS